MATVTATENMVERGRGQNESPARRRQAACVRCGGLLVRDFYMDMFAVAAERAGETVRCVQCGDVVDPVIRRNRCHQHPTVQAAVEPAIGPSAHGQCSM